MPSLCLCRRASGYSRSTALFLLTSLQGLDIGEVPRTTGFSFQSDQVLENQDSRISGSSSSLQADILAVFRSRPSGSFSSEPHALDSIQTVTGSLLRTRDPALRVLYASSIVDIVLRCFRHIWQVAGSFGIPFSESWAGAQPARRRGCFDAGPDYDPKARAPKGAKRAVSICRSDDPQPPGSRAYRPAGSSHGAGSEP